MAIKVCMLSCTHGLKDDRIYWKEALTLARNGYEVSHVALQEQDSDGYSDEGIRLIGIRKSTRFSHPGLNKLWQFFFSRRSVYETVFLAAAKLDADIYHFHDLQLNLLGSRLKQLPHQPVVIYDVHEDYAQLSWDSVNQGQLAPLKRRLIKWLDRWEKKKAGGYDAIIATDDHIYRRFLAIPGSRTVSLIYNYSYFPPADERMQNSYPGNKQYDLIYSGTISPHRGLVELLLAIELLKQQGVKVKVLLIGDFSDQAFSEKVLSLIKQKHLDDCVIYREFVPFEQIKSFYEQSSVGVALFAPSRNSRTFIPIKLFEYMSLGLPVLATNIGPTAEYVQKNNCGIVCDPLDTAMVAAGIRRLLEDKNFYERLRSNGLAAARQYGWPLMGKKLLDLYEQLLKKAP